MNNHVLSKASGLDVQGALDRLGGKKVLYIKALKLSKSTYVHACETIAQCLAEGDREAAARTAHNVRNMAGFIGATGLYNTSFDLEKAVADQRADINGCLARLQRELTQTLDSIDMFLAAEEGQTEDETSEKRSTLSKASRRSRTLAGEGENSN